MAENTIKRKSQNGEEVDILGPTYEAGAPEEFGHWRHKLGSRDRQLGYLKNGERYWFRPLKEWFGSERRRTPA